MERCFWSSAVAHGRRGLVGDVANFGQVKHHGGGEANQFIGRGMRPSGENERGRKSIISGGDKEELEAWNNGGVNK
jgi:hypothetical protein